MTPFFGEPNFQNVGQNIAQNISCSQKSTFTSFSAIKKPAPTFPVEIRLLAMQNNGVKEVEQAAIIHE